MAKTSMTMREQKRIQMVKKYATERKALKDKIKNLNLSDKERWEAQMQLQALPRDSSKVRLQRRCYITGRPHAVYRKFGLCRNKFREYAMKGEIPGLVKASW